MKKAVRLISLAIVGLMAFTLFTATCVPKTSILVNGVLFGRPLQTTVDNELAKQMLTDSSSMLVTKLFSDYQDKPLNTNTLAEIAANNSMDVATLYFMQRAYQDTQNKQAQDLYHSYLDNLSDGNFKEDLIPLTDFYLVFVPGLHYNDTNNRGNFARQRRLLATIKL